MKTAAELIREHINDKTEELLNFWRIRELRFQKDYLLELAAEEFRCSGEKTNFPKRSFFCDGVEVIKELPCGTTVAWTYYHNSKFIPWIEHAYFVSEEMQLHCCGS